MTRSARNSECVVSGIYICIYLFLFVLFTMSYVFTLRTSYVQAFVCGVCGILSVLCAGFRVPYVQSSVCVMCGV